MFDRSGSMSGTLKELCKEMKLLIRSVSFGDTITLMWFSGPNQKGTMLKGFKLHAEEDFAIIDKIIDANNTTVGTTCFSESLLELPTILNDLECFSSNYAFTLFTDGYPIVSDINKEIKNINHALDQIQDKNISVLLIGYGDYYNKELMTEMSTRVGGSLLHNNDLKEWNMNMNNFLSNVDSNKIQLRFVISRYHSRGQIIFVET